MDISAFSRTVCVRSVANRNSIFTTVPFDYRGGGGDGGGGVPNTLPTASATIKGGIKVGSGLRMDSSTDVLSVVFHSYHKCRKAPAFRRGEYVKIKYIK